MKRSRAALTVLAVLLSACASEPARPSVDLTVDPKDAVLDAMTAVYEAGTMHQEFEMSMSGGGQSFSMTGEGDVDNDRQRISMTMDLGMLGGSMDMILDGGVVYMRSPAFREVGSEWVSMDPSKLDPAAAARFGGLGSTDPSSYVGLFAGVLDVRAGGEQVVGGVATTRYAGTIDLKKVLEGFAGTVGEQAGPAAKEQLELALEQFEALGLDDRLPFEIWIDEAGLPRRERITMDFGSLLPGAVDAKMEMTVDFSAFGEPVRIELPPRSKVTDITEIVGQATGASGS